MGLGDFEVFGFKFQWFDYVATFGLATIIFSVLWLVDFESIIGGIAYPLNHEDIGLILAVISLTIVLLCSAGLIKVRKSRREDSARILFYIMLIFACVFWQNLYDLFARLGLEVFV